MREKYTALCPVLVIRSTLLSRDSLRITPTSAFALGQLRQASNKTIGNRNCATLRTRIVGNIANPLDSATDLGVTNALHAWRPGIISLGCKDLEERLSCAAYRRQRSPPSSRCL